MTLAAARALLLALALLAPAAAIHAVDLRDPFTRAVEDGNAAYESGQFDKALSLYNDALLQRPVSFEARMNRGLANGQLGNFEEALGDFKRAAELAGKDDVRRADAAYNEGRARLGAANLLSGLFEDLPVPPDGADPDAAIREALAALRSFDQAMALRPNFEEAAHNRSQAQHLIQALARRQPPPEQQGSSSGESDDSQGEGEEQNPSSPSSGDQQDQQDPSDPSQDSEQQDPSQEPQDSQQGDQQQGDQRQQPQDQQQPGDQQQDQPQDGEQQQQPQGGKDQQQEDESQQGQQDQLQDGQQGNDPQQQQQPQDADDQQGQGQGQPQGESREMSEEEAQSLLNLLGSRDVLVRRLPPKWRSDDRQRKNW